MLKYQKKKTENMSTDSCCNSRGQKCHKKEAEKETKYNVLCVAIEGMCNMRCLITTVTVGATGTVTNGLRGNLEAIPGKHSVDSVQRAAVPGTAHIIRKVLQSENGRLAGGDQVEYQKENTMIMMTIIKIKI